MEIRERTGPLFVLQANVNRRTSKIHCAKPCARGILHVMSIARLFVANSRLGIFPSYPAADNMHCKINEEILVL
jgi:hypothetical protein